METRNFSVAGNRLAADNGRPLMQALFRDCPISAIMTQEIDGYIDGDDFNFMFSEDGSDDFYQKYIDTGNTIRLVASSSTVYGGQLALVTDATDNDSPVIQRVGVNAASGNIVPAMFSTTTLVHKHWFQARLKVTSVADDVNAFACGFAQVGRAADNGLLEDNTGDIVDSISFIGFRVKHTNGGTTGTNAILEFVWQDGAQTAPVVCATSLATLVADTFINIGFKYDPLAEASKKISIFVNNLESTTYGTKTQMEASTFPSLDPMAFVLGQKNGSAAAGGVTIDKWFHVIQY